MKAPRPPEISPPTSTTLMRDAAQDHETPNASGESLPHQDKPSPSPDLHYFSMPWPTLTINSESSLFPNSIFQLTRSVRFLKGYTSQPPSILASLPCAEFAAGVSLSVISHLICDFVSTVCKGFVCRSSRNSSHTCFVFIIAMSHQVIEGRKQPSSLSADTVTGGACGTIQQHS